MLKRGFKTWCENISCSFRRDIGLAKDAPLPPNVLASFLKVKLITPHDITVLSDKEQNMLLKTEAASWSAVTVTNGNDHVVVYNSTHSESRQSNDIMHELAHIIIGHRPQTTHYFSQNNIFLREYYRDQEEEADCLASTLLLPRDALVKIKYSQIPTLEAAKTYFVSKELLNMRLNVAGVNIQFNRSNKQSSLS